MRRRHSRHCGHGDAAGFSRVLVPRTARRGSGAVRHPDPVSRRRHRGGGQAALPGDDAEGTACGADGDGAAAARAGSAGAVAGAPAGPVDGGGAAVHGSARGAGRVSEAVRAGSGAEDVLGAGGRRSESALSEGGVEPNREAAWAVTGGRGAGGAERRDVGGASGGWAVPVDATDGRTHQLRVHMASLGLPILGDPLYPNVIDVAPDDFSQPLQLLACAPRVRGSGERASARVCQ